MNYFIFNGHSSAEFGIRINKKSVYGAPKRDASLISIPGRNGDIIYSNKKYSNVNISYTCFVSSKSKEELADKLTLIKNWLYKECDSYHALTDTYEPNFKKIAVFNNKLDITDEVSKIGSFTITFSCKPLRYLISGLDAQSYTDVAHLHNTYITPSKPYIKIYGNGDGRLILTNGDGVHVWNISSIDEYIELDSELMSAFKDTELKNNLVSGEGFPELIEGQNSIRFEGNITRIDIIPRWVSL